MRVPAAASASNFLFTYCGSLRAVEFAPGFAIVGAFCFSRSGLRRATIPADVREIGEGTFEGCGELRRLDFAPGSALELIGSRAFRGTRIPRDTAFPAGARVAEDAF